MTVLFCFVTAIIGILLGGVLSRLAYALPREEFKGVFSPCCPSCGRPLPRRVLIPIVGSILLAFRCPHCGEGQGVKTLVSELLFGAVCLLLYLVYGFGYLFFVYALTVAILLMLSLIDLDIREIVHSLLLVILALGVLIFVFSFFSFSQTGTVWWEHLVGAFCVSLPLFILMMLTGGVGGGDVKLMFCLGFLLGYRLTLVCFFFGIVIAAIFSLVLRFVAGKGGKYPIPLVPFLSLGAVVAVLWGESLLALIF